MREVHCDARPTIGTEPRFGYIALCHNRYRFVPCPDSYSGRDHIRRLCILQTGRNSDSERDEGRGSLKQVYFYGISFAALMALIAGISLTVQSLLNVLFDNQTLSASSSNLAWGLSLFIVGLPIWAFHWRTILRNVAEMPVERRSIIRKLYMYLTLAVSWAS